MTAPTHEPMSIDRRASNLVRWVARTHVNAEGCTCEGDEHICEVCLQDARRQLRALLDRATSKPLPQVRTRCGWCDHRIEQHDAAGCSHTTPSWRADVSWACPCNYQ